jgi:hypothetical protein
MDRILTDPAEIRDALISDWSDTYKAAYGVRPRFDVGDWTDDELFAEIESLREEAEVSASAPSAGEGWAYEGDPRALDF